MNKKLLQHNSVKNVRNIRDSVLFLRLFTYVSIISLVIIQLVLYLLVKFKKTDTDVENNNFIKATFILNQIIFWVTVFAGSISCFYVMYQKRHAFIYDYIRNFESLNYYSKKIELYKKQTSCKNWEFELNFDSIVFYMGFNYLFVLIILILSKLTNNMLLFNFLYPKYRDFSQIIP